MTKRYYPVTSGHVLHQPKSGTFLPWDNKTDFTPDRIQRTVSFTGHRIIAASEVPKVSEHLLKLLEQAYAKGWREFISGGALGFDTIAAQAVLKLQIKHPDVRLHLAIPCQNQSERWRESDQLTWQQLTYLADDVHVLSPHYYNGCMQVRNRFMVDHSALVICYMNHNRGGTVSCVGYAIRKDKPVVNLAIAMQDGIPNSDLPAVNIIDR